jgi:hypothetical protein
METSILRLSFHRPDDLSEEQWAGCIFLSYNLAGNSAPVESYMPTLYLERIQSELEARIDAGPDLMTIEWLWDEFKSYSKIDYQQYRPTLPHWWEDISTPGGGHERLLDFQTWYKERVTER